MQYWTKHFNGFDVAVDENGKAFILSEAGSENEPQIGPFNTPAQAIEFGANLMKDDNE